MWVLLLESPNQSLTSHELPGPLMKIPKEQTANSKPPRRGRRLIVKLGFSLAIGLLALKLGDVAIGRFRNTQQRHWERLTPNAVVRHQSTEFDYVFRTNSLGFRGPDVPFDKPAGTKRIVVLGDSFVAGLGVADDAVFTVPLQKRLRASGQSVDVVNLGRAGSSTIAELNLYEQYGRRFQPDVVVLVFFVGNDLTEITEELSVAELKSWKPPGWLRGWCYTAFPNLYLEFAMMRHADAAQGESTRSETELAKLVRNEASRRGLDAMLCERRLQAMPAEIREAVCQGKFPLVRLMHACLDPDRRKRSLNPDPEFLDRAWPRVRSHLDQLKSSVERDGAELRVVLLPASVQVDPQAIRFNRSIGFTAEDSWLTDESLVETKLQAWCRTNGVASRNLVSDFREAKKPIYHIQDSHLNKAGHALMAKILAEWLEDVR